MALAFIFFFCSLVAYAQTNINIDLHSLLRTELNLTIGQRMSEHWSISASVGANMKMLQKRKSMIEEEHNSEFPDGIYPEHRKYMHREHIYLCYWPTHIFKGFYISLGGEHRDTDGLDATVGMGYMFNIWKGLNGALAYDVGIIKATENEKLSISDLKVGISWTF